MRHVFLILLIGAFIGSAFTYVISIFEDSEYIRVYVLDKDMCTPKAYSIIMNDEVVNVFDGKIETESPHIVSGASALIRFFPEYNGQEMHKYRVKAEYLDCEALMSGEREAERGRLIYEWIENRKFKHEIRA